MDKTKRSGVSAQANARDSERYAEAKIRIRGARTHNLKNLNLDLPRNRLTVITGLFGMNVPLPTLLGSPEYQFWEIVALMFASSAALFVWFRREGWL